MRISIFILAIAYFGIASAETSQELIARIRGHMQQTLEGVPNYTCQMLVERFQRQPGVKQLSRRDALRLDVAVVARHELFAWPGEGQFKEREIGEFAKRGAFGTGNFATHLANALNSNGVTYEVHPAEEFAGRKAYRIGYKIPAFRKPYRVKIDAQVAEAGINGQFWADAANLDVLRLEFSLQEIPSGFPLTTASEFVEYERVRIGSGDFLLPRKAQLELQHDDDTVEQNRTTFSSCRQYSGESVIRFEGLAEETEAAKAPQEIKLPAKTQITLELRTAIDSTKVAIGDQLEAFVSRTVKNKGEVIIPKGAVVTGRLTRLERMQTSQQGTISFVGLEFTKIVFGSKFVELTAVLEEGGTIVSAALPGIRNMNRAARIFLLREPQKKGEEDKPPVVYSSSGKLELPQGSLLVIRTF